jgi:hypothetical protein
MHRNEPGAYGSCFSIYRSILRHLYFFTILWPQANSPYDTHSMIKRITQYWYKQIKVLVPLILFGYLPTLIAFVGIALFALAMDKRIWFFTHDPFVLGNLPSYAGILSNVGILLWCASAAICFFSVAVSKRIDAFKHWRRFLTVSGVFTLFLLFDDLFQLHRIFYVSVLHIPLIGVMSGYGLFALWYLLRFRQEILATKFLILALAFGLFAAAVILDMLSPLSCGNTASSDGLKLLGIVSWFTYFAQTCWGKIVEQGNQGMRSRP